MRKNDLLTSQIDPDLLTTNLGNADNSHLNKFNIPEEEDLNLMAPLEDIFPLKNSFSKKEDIETIVYDSKQQSDFKSPTFPDQEEKNSDRLYSKLRISVDTTSTKHPFAHRNKPSFYVGEDSTYPFESMTALDHDLITNPATLLLQQSNIQKYEYQGENKKSLQNTQSLNIPKDSLNKNETMGKIETVRHYVRQETDESLNDPIPTPNIPESPDSTRQLSEQNYRQYTEVGNVLNEIQENIPSFSKNQLTSVKKRPYQEEISSRSRKEEMREYIRTIKESLEEIYNEKFKNIQSNYQMKEDMHLKVIRELKRKTDTLLNEASQLNGAARNPPQVSNLTEREIDHLKTESNQKDQKITDLNLRIEQLESELRGESVPFMVQQKKIEVLEEENQLLKQKIKEAESSFKSDRELNSIIEARENELKEKYKKLEEHLTNKFKVETGMFFENIQREMEEILAGKGLSQSKRDKIELEVREELRKELKNDKSSIDEAQSKGRVSSLDENSNYKLKSKRNYESVHIDKGIQANAISFGFFANKSGTINLADISNPDELEIKVLENQIKRELEAEIVLKEKNLLRKYAKKEAEIKVIQEQIQLDRAELARQKSLLNVRMVKFKEERKELIRLKKMKQTEIEAGLINEYNSIQKEAEFLKKEVEFCYQQLQEYQTGQKSRGSNIKSVNKSRSKSKARKSFSGLKEAISKRKFNSQNKSRENRSTSPINVDPHKSKGHKRTTSLIDIQGDQSQMSFNTMNENIGNFNEIKSTKTEAAIIKDEPTFGNRHEQYGKKHPHKSRRSNSRKKANGTGNFGYQSEFSDQSKPTTIHRQKSCTSKSKKSQCKSYHGKEIQIINHPGTFTPGRKSMNEDTTDRYSIKELSFNDDDDQLMSEDRIRNYLNGNNSTQNTREDALTQTERLLLIEPSSSTEIEFESSEKKPYNRDSVYDSVLEIEAANLFDRRPSSVTEEHEHLTGMPETSYGSRLFQDRDLDSYTKQRHLTGNGRNLYHNPFSTPPPNRYSTTKTQSYLQQYQTRSHQSKSRSKSRSRVHHTDKHERNNHYRNPDLRNRAPLNFDRRKQLQFDRYTMERSSNKENNSRYSNIPKFHEQGSSGKKKHNMLRKSNKKPRKVKSNHRDNIRGYVKRILKTQQSFQQADFPENDSHIFKQRELSRKNISRLTCNESRLEHQARDLLQGDYNIQLMKSSGYTNMDNFTDEYPDSIQSINQNLLDETLNKNNPTQFGFSMLDKIFDTGNGIIRDTEKTLQLKSLRNEIQKLRVDDSKLLPKTIVKISQFSSGRFLMKLQGFKKFSHHYCKKFGFDLPYESGEQLSTNSRHFKIVEEMVKDCFLNLEELWKATFTSHSAKLHFLKKLATSETFKLYFQALNGEIEHLITVKEQNKRAIELMDLREMLKQDFLDLSYHYRNLQDIKQFVRDGKVKECVTQIQRVSKDILKYLDTFDSENGAIQIKFYGIGMDVIAKLDLWEIDYVTKVEKQYQKMFNYQTIPEENLI